MLAKLLEQSRVFEANNTKPNYQQLLLVLSKTIIDLEKVNVDTDDAIVQETLFFLYNNLSSRNLFLSHLSQKLLVLIYRNARGLTVLEWRETPNGEFNRLHVFIVKEMINSMRCYSSYTTSIDTHLSKLITVWNKFISSRDTNLNLIDKTYIDLHYYLLKLSVKLLALNVQCGDIVLNFLHAVYMDSIDMIQRIFGAVGEQKCQLNHRIWRTLGKLLLVVVERGKYDQFKEAKMQFCRHVLTLLSNKRFQLLKIVKTNLCRILLSSSSPDNTVTEISEQTGRNIVIFLLKAVIVTKDTYPQIHYSTLVKDIVTILIDVGDIEESVSFLLVERFMDDDDQLISLLSLLLELSSLELFCILNIHHLFYYLLKSVAFDDSILIDWLVNDKSSARCFPGYIHKYLSVVLSNYQEFLKDVHNLYNSTHQTEHAPQLDKDVVDYEYQAPRVKDRSISKPSLVDYSSSDESEAGSTAENILSSEYSSQILSCLVRLHFKLERLIDKNILPQDLHDLVHLLESLEDLYEV